MKWRVQFTTWNQMWRAECPACREQRYSQPCRCAKFNTQPEAMTYAARRVTTKDSPPLMSGDTGRT